MQSATKHEHKAKAAQAIMLESRSVGVFFFFFFPFLLFFTRFKDERDAERETRRRRYPRTISSAVRGPETRANVCSVHKDAACDVQASHFPHTHMLGSTHIHVILSSLAIFARLLRNAISCRRGTWHTATQHPTRQIAALFALLGTSKRNKDLGTSWFLWQKKRQKIKKGIRAKQPMQKCIFFSDIARLDDISVYLL